MDSQQNQPSTPAPTGKRFNFNGILSGYLIPRVIAVHAELSPGARLLWGAIHVLARKQGYCWSSNAHLARRLAVSERQVARYCRQLERAGFLETEARPGSTPRRWLLMDPAVWGTEPATPDGYVRGSRQKRQGGVTDLSPKGLYLGSELVPGLERDFNQSVNVRSAGNGPQRVGELIEQARASLDRLPKSKAEAAKRTLTTAADMSELAAIRRELTSAGFEPTNSTVERLMQKGQFYGRNGYQVAAAISRGLKNTRRSPSTAPRMAAWFLAVVENAFANQAASAAVNGQAQPSTRGST